MLTLFKIRGFTPYILIMFLNAMTDLGHKIVLQNTIFKAYSGSELIVLTAIVNALILLPFILLFYPAGNISDKYSKTKVVKYSALFAIFITSFITISYKIGAFWLAFLLTLILAAQSAIYSPAKYGLIKEMFGDKYIAEANGIVQSVTIISILSGAVIYSIFFEKLLNNATLLPNEILKHMYFIGYILIFSSILEFLLSIRLAKISSLKTTLQEELLSTQKTIKLLIENQTIYHSILGLGIFWGISQLVVAIFGEFLKQKLGITNTIISQGLLSLSGFGIVLGSLYAGIISHHKIEIGIVPLGILGISICLLFMPYFTNLYLLGIDIFLFGIFSGLFIVPLNSLIQYLSPKKELGRILAINNLVQNLVMFIFLTLTATFAYFNLSSKNLIFLASFIALVTTFFSFKKLAKNFLVFLVKTILSTRYNIKVYGKQNLNHSGAILLLGNHVSFLDWAILLITYPKNIRFVIDREYYKLWYFKPLLKLFKVIPISTRASKEALIEIHEALKKGDTVGLFPEGYLTKNGHLGKFQKGFEKACKNLSNAKIIPFYINGLWGDKFSKANKILKNTKSKNISITYGEPLLIDSDATTVEQKVKELSYYTWQICPNFKGRA